MTLLRTFLAAIVLLAPACAPAAPAIASGPLPAFAPGLAAELDAIFSDTAFAHAHWGVLVRSRLTGNTVYARNAERMFLPASNVKLFTGAAALHALGREYRYVTPVLAGGVVEGGVLRGDLYVVGSGDPAISRRFVDDPRDVFRAWADSLRARGVVRVAGSVVGDARRFEDPPLGRGWAWDDVWAAYSAEFGPLQFDDGIVTVHVRPGAAVGEPVRVTLEPATAYAPVVVQARTAAAGTEPSITVRRAPHAHELVVAGTLPLGADPVGASVAVRDVGEYFVTVLRETLSEAGIAVDGGARVVRGEPGPPLAATHLFDHRSPPMDEIVVAFMKPSQNQIAEILLRTLGAELRGAGTAAAGIAVIDSLSAVWGLDPAGAHLTDGSGLSRYNLLTPAHTVALLDAMAAQPYADVFRASLPVAGVDGTLANRLQGTVAAGNVTAKTGTLTGARALSGYLMTLSGEQLTFSVIANNHVRTARDVDAVVDAALVRLIESVVLMAGGGPPVEF